MFRNGPYLNISYYGPDLITLHTVDFGVSVTFAVFLKGCGSPSVFKLLSILKINLFTSYGNFFYLWVISSPR
jgi:hypothetical protein